MSELAAILYGAYCAHTGWKSLVSGQPLPLWGDVRNEIKDAWRASADAAREYLIGEPSEEVMDAPQQWTKVLMLAAAIALGAYDVWALWQHGRAATLSVVLLEVSQRYPILPFGLGLLAGHVFWPVK
jgi:hypothetical protein